MTENILITLSRFELKELLRELIAESQSLLKPQVPQLDDLLNIDQAATYLNLSKATLYGFTSKREIPHTKKGKKLHFRRSELVSWLNEGKQKTQKQLKTLEKRRA